MEIDVNYIITNQEKIQEMFDSEKWKKEICIEKREMLVLSLFHSENWKQILPENRIYILQEVENIEAEKQKGKPYKFSLVGEKHRYNKRKFDLLLTHSTKTIFIKEDLLQSGRKQIVDSDNEEIEIDINNMLNVYLLASIYHEQLHIKTNLNIRRGLENLQEFVQNKATIEEREYIIWLLTKIDLENLKGSKTMLEVAGNYYLYSVVPDEYYAFKVARERTIDAFSKVQEEFGIDKGLPNYIAYIKQREKEIEKGYYKDRKRKLSYKQIYLENMRETIEEMARQRNVDIDTVYEEYCISKERYNDYKDCYK